MMYRVALATLLAMLATGSGAGSIRDPEALVVHEWGTFTSIAGENGEALAWSPQLGSDDLPCFVERFRRYRGKGFVRGTVRMETPVLYFYAPRETSVNVSVGFPGGLITEWFPRAEVSPTEPVADDGLARPRFMGRAKWTGVRVLPGSREDFPTQGRSSHYYLARQTRRRAGGRGRGAGEVPLLSRRRRHSCADHREPGRRRQCASEQPEWCTARHGDPVRAPRRSDRFRDEVIGRRHCHVSTAAVDQHRRRADRSSRGEPRPQRAVRQGGEGDGRHLA